MTRTYIPVCLFNFRIGGFKAHGVYEFKKLTAAFSKVVNPPALIVINEAYEWQYWGEEGLLGAAAALSQKFGRPYVGKVGYHPFVDAGPAIFYNPLALTLLYWGGIHPTVAEDRRNIARFRAAGSDEIFEVIVEHWNHRSGRARMSNAERIMGFGRAKYPVLEAGDQNEPASGLHLPQADFTHAPPHERVQKGKKLADGTYVAHTDAVDRLVGSWDARYQWGKEGIRRIDGNGFHMVAELAAMSGTPPKEAFLPTVNEGIDKCGSLLIDMLLINDMWRKVGGVLPGTYKVHVPPGKPAKWPSDHRLVEAILYL